MLQFLRNLLPSTARLHKIRRGPLKGMRIHSSWHDYPRAILGTAELPLSEWIRANVAPGETWLDVGAHHGVTAMSLCRRVGPTGRVFAFEPVLATAGSLGKTRDANRLSQLTIVPVALGDVAALTRLSVSPEFRGMIGIAPGMRKEERQEFGEIVWEVSLDAIWSQISSPDDRVHGVKIDVQGAESFTIRGMRELLMKHRPKLVVEYHDYADLAELRSALESAGYSSSGEDIDSPSTGATRDLVGGHNYEFRRLPDTA